MAIICTDTLPLLNQVQNEVRLAKEDLTILSKITELSNLLATEHSSLSNAVAELQTLKRTKQSEKQDQMINDPVLTSLDLLVTTNEGIESLNVRFHRADIRAVWESTFNEAKNALRTSHARRPLPTFHRSIVMPKSRAGLHLSCATPTTGRNTQTGLHDLWVCDSDGYLGQVGVINIRLDSHLDENVRTHGVANSRISAICSVSVVKGLPQKRISKRMNIDSTFPDVKSMATTERSGHLELESDSSDNDDTQNTQLSGSSRSTSPTANTIKQLSAEEEEQTATVWLGSEDGEIFIFNFNDRLTRKPKIRTQLQAAVTALVQVDNRVFISFGNGQLLFFERFQESRWVWDLNCPRIVHFDSTLTAPISAMVSVANRLWFSSRNHVFVFNPKLLLNERVFQVNSDAACSIACMSTIGSCLFLAIHGSPVVKLYHVFSFDCLLDMNISPLVTKTLAGSDDIIRQHKLACLRVTALFCNKEQLWVGTSAGIILNVAIPHISPNINRINTAPTMTVCHLGHSGPCRFLTNVDLSPVSLSRENSFTSSGLSDGGRRRMSLNVGALNQGKMYVISGGDGIEDFHDMNADENDDVCGREDGSNYLLFWQV